MICVLIDAGTILGYNLTDTDSMKNQYDYLYPSSLDELSRYVRLLTVRNVYLMMYHVGYS